MKPFLSRVKSVVFVRQKFKHCFVACCASMLGRSDIECQLEIVRQFPLELQLGDEDEGVPKDLSDAIHIIKKLGISSNPACYENPSPPFEDQLKANTQLEEKVFILTRYPSNHCIGIKKIFPDCLLVMDPEYFHYRTMTWKEFNESDPRLLVL